MLIVADTSPLNYLVLIKAVHVLPALHERIVIPPEVLAELRDADGPPSVRQWAASVPAWLEVIAPTKIDSTLPLDPGELAAIALAHELRADRLLVDEREARAVAERLGIPVAGTLAVLRDAAFKGLVDLRATFDRLRETSFRAAPALFDQVLAEFDRRRAAEGR